MHVRIGEGATDEEASAVAAALAEHLGTDIEVLVGDDDDAAATAAAPETEYPLEDDLGPTERERNLREEIEEILGGGPEKYKQRLPEQGKLFVRDRLDLWFGEGGDGGPGDADREGAADGVQFEDGKFAAFDEWHPDSPEVEAYDENNRLPGDGLLTGAATFEDRDALDFPRRTAVI
ncbi:MAG: acyl-CoA carboxylase subunit beta, partial [Halolamina sp.]